MMLTPNSERDEVDEGGGDSGLPTALDISVKGQPDNRADEALNEALDYFRQEPVPVKKTRSLWPFRKRGA